LGETWGLVEIQIDGSVTGQPLLLRRPVIRTREFFLAIPEGLLALYCELRFPGVFHRFSGEEGVHGFQWEGEKEEVLVFTGLPEVEGYRPPLSIRTRGATQLKIRRRDYGESAKTVVDHELHKTVPLVRMGLATALNELLLRRHHQLAEALIE
jgi:hypothetical protein